MKRRIFLMLITCILCLNTYPQDFGSWIVPPYRFDFHANGVVTNDDLIDPEDSYYFSDGAFKSNGDLLFYIIDLAVFDKNSSFVGYLEENPYANFSNEVEIINVPGQEFKFYVIWSWINPPPYYQTQMKYNMVDCSNGIIQIGFSQTITSIVTQAAFALTQLQNNTRYLFIAKLGGLDKYLVNNQSISFVNNVVDWGNPTLNDSYYFMAHNLELNQGENTIAWVSGVECDHDLFIVNLDAQGNYLSAAKFELWPGIISGIEFADVAGINSNVIFASCQGDNGGIKRFNYVTGSMLTPLTNDGTFDKSFLEKASDGNIYVVSNDGNSLGRIIPSSNSFLPNTVVGLNLLSSLTVEQLNSIYKLPHDNSTYYLLDLELDILNYVSCPGGNDGELIAIPIGGTPPYSYSWQPGGYTTQTVTGLSEHTYICVVTDANGYTAIEDIELTLNPAMFDESTHLFNSSITLSDWDKKLKMGMVIYPDVEVTLQNSHIQFGKDAKVKIMPRGKLILDNCILENHQDCPDRWYGIEVWGDYEKHQYKYSDGKVYQGWLIMKNGTTIKNADIGVLLSARPIGDSKEFVKEYDGGIVQVPNNGSREIPSAKFINNKQSIVFWQYRNWHPNDPMQEWDNRSYLENCVTTHPLHKG